MKCLGFVTLTGARPTLTRTGYGAANDGRGSALGGRGTVWNLRKRQPLARPLLVKGAVEREQERKRRRELERAFERDPIEVALDFSAWSERPGVYHPEVSSRARWASEQRELERLATTATAAAAGERKESTRSGSGVSASAPTMAPGTAPSPHTDDESTNTGGRTAGDAPVWRDGAMGVSEYGLVYYKRRASSSRNRPTGILRAELCIWCEGTGVRPCRWCEGTGSREVKQMPGYQEWTALMDRAVSGDEEARDRIRNPPISLLPCHACHQSGVLRCARCHGTGTNHL